MTPSGYVTDLLWLASAIVTISAALDAAGVDYEFDAERSSCEARFAVFDLKRSRAVSMNIYLTDEGRQLYLDGVGRHGGTSKDCSERPNFTRDIQSGITLLSKTHERNEAYHRPCVLLSADPSRLMRKA